MAAKKQSTRARSGGAAAGRGSKSKYSAKQRRQAEHIEEGYLTQGVNPEEAASRAWATVNKTYGGGLKGGSGHEPDQAPARRGGANGGSKSGGGRGSTSRGREGSGGRRGRGSDGDGEGGSRGEPSGERGKTGPRSGAKKKAAGRSTGSGARKKKSGAGARRTRSKGR